MWLTAVEGVIIYLQLRIKEEAAAFCREGSRGKKGGMPEKERYVDREAGIYLRPMTREDTDRIIAWRNSDGVRKNFIYQELFTRQSHENWIRTMVETGRVVQMIICDIAADIPLGSVYIRDIDRQHSKAEYGIFIGEPAARGRGIGTAAAKLMLRYSFEEEKLHRVYLRALAGNTWAIRSYEKAGFVKEGCLKEDVCINGKYWDIIWMAALAEDWTEPEGA